jgi:uncharacterized membrane protein
MADVERHKGMALAGYVCFVIPLVLAPNSKFARFHANQGLLLWIALAVCVVTVIGLQVASWLAGVVFSRVAILAFFFGGLFHLLQFALLVTWVGLMIYGMLQALGGERKPLPGIGHWNVIS